MKLGQINLDSIKLSSDEELLNLLASLRSLWIKKIALEKVLPSAALVLGEIKGRNLKFTEDEFLQQLTEIKEADYAPVYSSGETMGEEIFLEQIKQYYDKPIKLVENAVNLVGGLVIWGKTKNDFEQLIRIPPKEELIRRIIFRLDRAIPDLKLRARMHALDDFWGPFTDAYPLYDLCLVPSQSQLLQMSDDLSEQEVRAKSPEAARQAKKAQRQDKITLGEFFLPLKSSISALMAYRIGEKFSVEAMIEYLKQIAQRKKLETEIIPVLIQKKYD